jgi:hypothetical protein
MPIRVLPPIFRWVVLQSSSSLRNQACPIADSHGYNRQWVDTAIPLDGVAPCRTLRRLARSLFDGIEQHLGGKRFAKESDPACCSRLISNDLVVQASHENDWICEAVRGE